MMSDEELPVVYKTCNSGPEPDGFDGHGETFTDFQIDVIAEGMALLSKDLRSEFQASIDRHVTPLRERVIALEAQISAMLALLNIDGNRSIEASETSTIRKLRVSG
jgi:hypothetical protein